MQTIVGLDLGQSRDFTALTVTTRKMIDEVPHYDVGHIERVPLGTSYPAIVEHTEATVGALLKRPDVGTLTLVVDRTGVGRPVGDLLKDARLRCRLVLVTITGGDVVTVEEDDNYRVPKRDLAGAVQVLLQARRLHIASGLSFAETLTGELKDFRVKISLSGHDSYGAPDAGGDEDWRERPHDDLVLALALSAWFGETVKTAPTSTPRSRGVHNGWTAPVEGTNTAVLRMSGADHVTSGSIGTARESRRSRRLRRQDRWQLEGSRLVNDPFRD